ncbi:hypothetical protein [Lysinibacillus phage vB_LspM-01]|nr:hypothetical protein [Lysinibacillus phage vB_LspM-01]
MVRVSQVLKHIERYEVIRKDLTSKIADKFNDDQVFAAKELIKQLDDVTLVLSKLYNMEIKTDDVEIKDMCKL